MLVTLGRSGMVIHARWPSFQSALSNTSFAPSSTKPECVRFLLWNKASVSRALRGHSPMTQFPVEFWHSKENLPLFKGTSQWATSQEQAVFGHWDENVTCQLGCSGPIVSEARGRTWNRGDLCYLPVFDEHICTKLERQMGPAPFSLPAFLGVPEHSHRAGLMPQNRCFVQTVTTVPCTSPAISVAGPSELLNTAYS